ncbi:hypothetical protein C0Q58_11400 [Streptomyces albidoflavus]|nr:hypothetical protein C0Q58_11400 [Streptomyces albidoflavus]
MFREALPAFQRSLIELLEWEWLECRLAKSRRKSELWDGVFATELAREHRYATVDYGLVHALPAAPAGSGRAWSCTAAAPFRGPISPPSRRREWPASTSAAASAPTT